MTERLEKEPLRIPGACLYCGGALVEMIKLHPTQIYSYTTQVGIHKRVDTFIFTNPEENRPKLVCESCGIPYGKA